jgi:hypothetical protein
MKWETVMLLVDFLKALLTPTIAVLTAVIAVAQYRLAKAKYRHELYERRSAIFKATMKFIAQVKSEGNAKLDDAHTFLKETAEVAFFFKNKEIQPFLKSLYDRGIDLHTANRKLEAERDKTEREKLANQSHDALIWFGEQFDKCTRLFAPEMSLVRWKAKRSPRAS